MAFLELGRLVAELEVEEIDGPALEVVRNGTCPADRAKASLDRWRAKRARGEDISRNLLARALLDGGHDPPAADTAEPRSVRIWTDWMEPRFPDAQRGQVRELIRSFHKREGYVPLADELARLLEESA